MRTTLACSLLLALAPLAWAQASPPCDAAPEIREALDAANYFPEVNSREERQERRLNGIQELLRQHPDNFFVRMAHANALPNVEREWNAGIAAYRHLLEQRPDDVRRLVYYARVLIGRNTPEAIAHLNRVLEKAHDFAPAYLLLAEIHAAPAFRDKANEQRELEEYVRLCPASLAPYWAISRLDKSPFVEKSAERLRALIESRTDRPALQTYGPLWAMEFKVAPPARHAELRRRVEADIGRIQASKAIAERGIPYVLASGYKLIGKAEEAKAIEDQAAAPLWRALAAFHKEHPQPKADDTREKRQEYNRALLKASASWLDKWPRESDLYDRRLWAMAAIPEELPAADIETACDTLLELTANRVASAWDRPLPIRIAEIYVAKGIRLDRVAELVKRGLTLMENPAPDWDLYPPSQGSEAILKLIGRQARWAAWDSLAQAAIKLGKPAGAHEPLAQMRDLLAASQPTESAPDADKNAHENNQRAYWRRMGELAEAEDRGLDTLAWYSKLLAAMPEENKKGRETLTAKQKEIWKKLGGTDEAWLAWSARIEPARGDPSRSAKAPPGAPKWTKLDKPLPEFDVPDLAGKKWTLADLKGKTTLVAVWASW